ncbi:Holliday junction branch migration protein RuvA [Lactovum miscens]|uniref:Holliday junction branch migration complex subunit RuvA n=1 Tax=Lactovum miscens TaxID=190387 RepID=A0A841C213_9LACT|nr:Holliday junction branch migration protein RuvA [Lactovum miscens]MBB5887966.1 Holliday junction DNA helicase RuvA [Lactovum miscens]
MYEYLLGTITKIKPTYIVLDVMGVGYLLSVANPYSWDVNTSKKVYVHQVVREDAQTLYGFVNEEEKEVFLKLISVSGIGPKSALAIIARADNVGLVNAIDNSDITYLTKFPGVGKKTASQMVLDLAGKFVPQTLNQVAKVIGNQELGEALEALEALGYKGVELKKIIPSLEAETNGSAESYIKLALKLLIK